MDFQRTVAFVVFSLSLLLLWEAWQDHTNPQPAQVVEEKNATSVQPADIPNPTQNPAELPAAVAQETVVKGARAHVKTDVIDAVIDANGGDIRELVLSQYRQNDDKDKPFVLFEEAANRHYFAQSGFVGNGLPTHKTIFELQPGNYDLKEGQSELKLTMRAVSEGLEVIRTYTFTRGSYVIGVANEVRNLGSAAVEGYPYYQLLRDGQAPEGESAFMYTFTGPAIYTDAGKFQKVSFDDIAKKDQEHTKQANDGWVGMVQHHFVSAWLTPDPADPQQREFYTRALGNGDYTAGLIMAPFKLEPGQSKNLVMSLYAGPQDQEKLKALATGLEHVVDYGWLTILAYPIFVLLNWIQNVVVNWGVAIILLTVLIKLVFYPLSAASYKSMAKMRKMAPRLQQIKEIHGDNRQALHEEMMKVYKQENINPLGGCLPIFIQIPVFIALYWVLMGAVELRQAPFALWITDLSQPDPYYVLPLVMAVTMFIQQRLSPTPPDPVQAKIMMFMPIAFSVFFFFFPAGLVLYWLVNNVLSIAQQWRINHVIESAGHGKSAKKQ